MNVQEKLKSFLDENCRFKNLWKLIIEKCDGKILDPSDVNFRRDKSHTEWMVIEWDNFVTHIELIIGLYDNSDFIGWVRIGRTIGGLDSDYSSEWMTSFVNLMHEAYEADIQGKFKKFKKDLRSGARPDGEFFKTWLFKPHDKIKIELLNESKINFILEEGWYFTFSELEKIRNELGVTSDDLRIISRPDNITWLEVSW